MSCVNWAREVMPSLANALWTMGFHRMGGKVQLLWRRSGWSRPRAIRLTTCELGVGEAVPARFCPRLRDDAPFHA